MHALAAPDSALRRAVGEWRLVADGSASAAYVRAEARKGGARFGAANWAMVSGNGPLAEGVLTLSLMGSLETLTTGECGFPGLLAGASTCPVNAVRDFQHPHPPLMEVSARQTWRIRGPVYLDVYAALVGEPALGPPMYLHRASAASDPIAPISAHETNPAHASAGVITAGLGMGEWKVEGSLFNGSPPDPDHFLPERGPLNSAAGRISFDPSPAWAMQASLGRIDAPAGHHTGAAGTIHTMTASLMHRRALRQTGAWTTSAILARMADGTLPRNSLLLESAASTGGAYTWFGRIEVADRLDSRVTIIENPDGSHEHLVNHRRVGVAQVAAGGVLGRTLRGAAVGVGIRGSVSLLPPAFEAVYQTRWPTSFSLYLSIRTGTSASDHHH